MLESENTEDLIVPRVDSELNPLVFSIRKIKYAEKRIEDIRITNHHKAPELLTVFNIAFLDIAKIIAYVNNEINKTKKKMKDRRSVLLIDIIPSMIEEKKIVNSKDIRDALVEKDDKYSSLNDILDQLLAIKELLDGKRDAIEMAYTSVKKILGERNFMFSENI